LYGHLYNSDAGNDENYGVDVANYDEIDFFGEGSATKTITTAI
jgi:hypothetical protein